MKQTSYFKIGLFTALSLAMVILFLVFLGVSNLFQTTELAETYFDESVQGLNVGSAVKYRGVTVGKVTAIGMVNQIYGPEKTTLSNEEQRLRLQARLDDPHKRWKLQASDFEDRKHWAEFMHAYQDAIAHTDSDTCPWFVIPSDSKPHRDLIVAQILVHMLEDLKLAPPKSTMDFDKVKLI